MNIEIQEFQFQGKLPLPILLGILINLLILSNSFAEASSDTKLLFLGNQNIAPVVYLDNTTPSGVAVDIVHAMAKHIPQPIEVKAMDWLEAQALVAGGEADALIQINQSEERKKIYDFSDSLLESQFSIFTSTNKMGISGLSSLRDLRIGVESGGLPQQLLETNPHIQLTIIPNFIEGFKLLNESTIDAVVVDYRVGSYIIAKNNIRNIKVTGEPIAFSYSSFAVKKGNTKLLNAINNALRIIKSDGTYQNIIDNWKPKEVVFKTREQISEMIYDVTILILLILFLIAVIWMVTLKRELTKRKAAEQKLRDQYSTLRSIIDSANALIFSIDRQYRYTSYNKGHAAVMKALYGAEIETGHSLLDYVIVPENREAARRNLDRALAGEQLVEEAYSGEELRSRQYFQVSHSPIKTETGEVIGVAALAQDMTERKRAEESLRRLNREMRAISQCNQILMRAEDEQTLLNDLCRIVCDEAGYRLVWVGYAENDEAKTVSLAAWAGNEDGYLADADIIWADTERGHGPTGSAIRSGESACIQDFTTEPQAAPWRENALQRGYRSSIAMPLKDENAKTFGVLNIYSTEPNAFTPDEIRLLEELAGDLAFGIVVLRARTERKQAEEELARHRDHLEDLVRERTQQLSASEQLYRQLFETMHQGVVYQAADGKIISMNPAAEQILGVTPSDFLGQTSVDREPYTLRKDGSPLPGLEHPATVGLQTGQEVRDVVMGVYNPREKGRRWINLCAVPMFRPGEDRPYQVYTLFEDVTERKRVEEEIRRLNQDLRNRAVALESANKELEAFAYSVSHDLRAPLRHIDGFLKLLQQRTATALDERSRHYMTTISDATRRMGTLIDDLLSFSRMGRHEMSEMQVDLGAVAQEVIREIEPEAGGRAICWQVADLPVVTGDRAMLRMVLVNLLSNALKFTRPREQAEIEIGCTTGRGTETIVFIRDNGVGFDMNYAGKLFGVFQRLHRVDEFEGTGIGLANVRRIINRHGGRTWAEGTVDHGATFYFSLP